MTMMDTDFKVAKEVALAIQKNPHLTPAELKQLFTMAKPAAADPTAPKKIPSLVRPFRAKSSVHNNNNNKKPTKPTERTLPQTPLFRPTGILVDFLESRQSHVGQDPSEGGGGGGDDSSPDGKPLSPFSSNDNRIRITGIIWKRRSGLGKYSTTSAWERRRVVLKGSKLYYYRTNVDTHDDEVAAAATTTTTTAAEDGLDEERSRDRAASEELPVVLAKTKSWFDTVAGTKSSSSTTKKDPRGYLDLVKEQASIGASSGHSGAPTPFSISIKVMTQTKWKFCFDTHGELMQWLAAMTDAIVQGSVDEYNSAILAANDPSRLVEIGYHGQLSEPPGIAHNTLAGHRLWATGHYKVQSEDYPDEGLADVSDDELNEEVQSDADDDDDGSRAPLNHTMEDEKELVVDMTGGTDIWGIPEAYIWQFALVLNIVMILARSSSTSVENFWYLITFANFSIFGLMTKGRVGGKVKSVMSLKMARRMSTTAMNTPLASPEMLAGPSVLMKESHEPNLALTKPKAGTTSMRIKNPNDLPVNKDGHVFAGWCRQKPGMMMVRSHNYKKDKVKVPSPGELYKCVHVDIFESRQRYPDMASRVQLPEVNFTDDGPKTWNAPDIFVVSIAIPTDPPKLYNSADDGGGYTITAYFVMEPETREILKRVTSDGYDPKNDRVGDMNVSKVNAVRLLDEWCRRSPTDDSFCARFKVVPNAQNLKEIGLPSWISKYNGKPFLIKRPGQTGFLYRHPDKSCVEFDISLHPFPYLAKQGINFMKDAYFKKVLVTFGFLIEGQAEDELPECLIGLMQLCYPDPVHAIQGEAFMAGTSPRSFE